MSIFLDFVDNEVKKKNKLIKDGNYITAKDWLLNAAEKAQYCRFVTHIGKYSHPDVKVSAYVRDKESNGKFLATSTADVCLDAYSTNGAQSIPAGKVLLCELEDGKTVYTHLLNECPELKKDVESCGVNYEDWSKKMLMTEYMSAPTETDFRIKQVYYPVNKEDYHVLSVLTPSSILQEIRRRTQKRNNEFYEAKRTGGKETQPGGAKRTVPIVEVAFGGTQPQNISPNTMKYGGNMFMLKSMPPKRKERNWTPYRDFFTGLRVEYYSNLFFKLHKQYRQKRNNKEIRVAARRAELLIMERLLEQACLCREEPDGWSDYRGLTHEQQVWLDNKYAVEREETDKWVDVIAKDMTYWIFDTYEVLLREEKVLLQDEEFKAMYHEAKDFLKNS